MPSSSKKTWIVKDYGSEESYEIQGTKLEPDPNNTNRAIIYDGEDVVAQLNNVESIRPKS